MKLDMSKISSLKTLFLFIAIALVMSFSIPTTISYDGFGYLSSGLSLFSSDFPHWYHLLREPGYPILIWICIQTGHALLALTIIQSIMIAHAAFILRKLLRKLLPRSKWAPTLSALLGLIMVRGFAATVLQQATILWVLLMLASLLSTNIENITSLKNSNQKLNTLKWLSLGVLAALINTALAVTVLLSTLYFWRSRIIKLVNFKPTFFALIGVVLVAAPWLAIIAPVDINSQAILSYKSGYNLDYFVSQDFGKRNEQRVQSFGALLNLSPEVYVGLDPKFAQIAGDSALFGSATNYDTWPNCLRKMEGPPNVVRYVDGILDERCIPITVLKAQSFLSKCVFLIFPLSGIFLLVTIGYVLFNRKSELLAILIVTLIPLLMYSIKGAGCSRYALIIPFIGPGLISFVALEWASRQKKIRQKEL